MLFPGVTPRWRLERPPLDRAPALLSPALAVRAGLAPLAGAPVVSLEVGPGLGEGGAGLWCVERRESQA